MTYIGVPQPSRALTSEDISDGIVTLADISFTDTPSNLNLNGLYNNQTMRLAHNITVTGDTTLENTKAFTVSSSSGLLVSSAGHNLSDNDQILVQSNATLPTGLSSGTYYFVINKTTDTFKLSTSIGGSAIAYTNAGSGTHTWFKDVNLVLTKISDDGNPVTLTNDGNSRTITGLGSIEASTLAQTPNSSLTGMTGTIGSAVTGGAGLSGMTSLGTVTTGTLGSGVNLDSATFPAGHIIQVLTGTHSTEAYTQSTSFVTMSLTVTITPKSALSKFFIICNTSGYNNEGSSQVGYYTIYRDSTNLGPAVGYANVYQGSGAGHDLGTNICISELDSPNTTSQITYGMYARTNNASYKTYWSMNSSKSDLTVMEIAG